MSHSKGIEAYTQGLTEADTLDRLRELMALYGDDLAIDAKRIVATMTPQDFADFRRGLKSERKGRFAGEAWAQRFVAVMMPEPMFTIATIAQQYGAPFDVAWKRLKDVAPEWLVVK